MKEKALLLLSGGLDSSVLLRYAQQQDIELTALFFDRNQKALPFEKAAAEQVSSEAGAHLDYVSISDWRAAIARFENANQESLMLRIPRNAIMLLLASPFALAYGCTKIFIGSSLDDATTPDSNEKFITSINNLLETVELKAAAADGMKQAVRVVAPFLEQRFKKVDIVRWAFNHLGRDFIEKTRSCYKSKPEPCGVCSACIKRGEAIEAVQEELSKGQTPGRK